MTVITTVARVTTKKKLDEDNSDKLNKEDEGIPNDTDALDENKKDEKEGNDDESDE